MDYRVHVRRALLWINNGLMLKHGIKAIADPMGRLSGREAEYLDRSRLAERFARFELER